MNRGFVGALAAVVGVGSSALAQVTLTGFATADNAFQASISTSPTSAGTPWFSGNNWPSTFSSSIDVSAPGTYFLQVAAQDFGRPEMFLAQFLMSGDGAFSNGGQVLVTNATDWVVSNSGLGVDTTAPLVVGNNGAGPWGFFPQMGPDAQFLWSPQYTGVAYFTATFTVAPAPGAAVALGACVLGVRRRRA